MKYISLLAFVILISSCEKDKTPEAPKFCWSCSVDVTDLLGPDKGKRLYHSQVDSCNATEQNIKAYEESVLLYDTILTTMPVTVRERKATCTKK